MYDLKISGKVSVLQNVKMELKIKIIDF